MGRVRGSISGTVPRTLRRFVTWRDALCVGVLGGLLLSTHWFTWNLSLSVPRGLYRWERSVGTLERGMLVQVPAVRFGRPWYMAWIPLLKPVAGVAGDVVCVWEGAGVSVGVDGIIWQHYGPVYREHKGKPLPVFTGCHVVGDGEVFVASHMPKSLDGRYFGMTPVRQTMVAVPVWTWGE